MLIVGRLVEAAKEKKLAKNDLLQISLAIPITELERKNASEEAKNLDEHYRWYGKFADEVTYSGECSVCGRKLDDRGRCGHESGGN